MAFTPNYNSAPFTQETYNFKEHYDENPFVIFDKEVFLTSKGSTIPSFTCYIKQKAEKYGDSLGYTLDEDEKRITLRILDKAGGIVVNQDMEIIDTHLGKWSYTLTPFDLIMEGSYEAQIILRDIQNSPIIENIIGKCRINVEN